MDGAPPLPSWTAAAAEGVARPLGPTTTVAKAVAVPPPFVRVGRAVTTAVAVAVRPGPVTVRVPEPELDCWGDCCPPPLLLLLLAETTESAMGMAATTPPETSFAGVFVFTEAAALAYEMRELESLLFGLRC